MTKLSTLPPQCASCYGQEIGSRYVDFEAAYDGPVLNPAEMRMEIDDLVLCERCLTDAANLLGWTTDDAASEIERLQRELDLVTGQRDEITEYVSKLENVVTVGRAVGRVPQAKGRPLKKPEVLA